MARDLESRIQHHGRHLLKKMRRRGPSFWKKDFWQSKVMDWSMRDPAFKVEMFRFVDVFPALTTPEDIAQHVQEYFCRPEQSFPAWVQFGLKSMTPGSLLARTAAGQIERNIRSMAENFVVGVDAKDAMPTIERLRHREGVAATLDLLGEACVSEQEADSYLVRYRELVRTLGEAAGSWEAVQRLDQNHRGPIPRANISLKLSSLYSQLDPISPETSISAVKRRLLPLFEEAAHREVFLNIDMEDYALKDLTLALFMSLLEEPSLRAYPHIGIVLQAYLRDSVDDAYRLIDWCDRHDREISVRLVKGAYWDYETINARAKGWPLPVYFNKWESDASFERLVQVLLSSPHINLAVASHNVRSVAAAIAAAEERLLPQSALEFQVLHGMAEPLKKALTAEGWRVRQYLPIGELVPGMAYLVRRLLENTSNEGFLTIAQQRDASPELLLRPPGLDEPAIAPEPVESEFLNAPHRDFSAAEEREAFADAIAHARATLGAHFPLVIDGVEEDTERRLVSLNPASDGEVVGTSACADEAQAIRAVEGARLAFESWSKTSVQERAALLRRVAARLEARRDELSALIVLEVGKNWREADADTAEAIDFCRYYADEAERWMLPRRLGRHPGEHNELRHRALGVGAVIAPWNFPLAILTGMSMAALVAGNTLVLKPAEQSPVIAGRFMEVLTECGLPPGAVQYLPGVGEEVGQLLVTHPHVSWVAFTGSREVGLGIIERAATIAAGQRGPRRVICEMGGKNAIIVDSDADLDEAVLGVLDSAFSFGGQKCSACSRVIIVGSAQRDFVTRLAAAVESIEIGPPEAPEFSYGPLIDSDAVAKVERYLELAKRDGQIVAQIEPSLPGNFTPYAVVGGVEAEHPLAQEEIFGPVLTILLADDFDEALEIANGTDYALTGGVYSRSPLNIQKARERFEVGNLYINRGCTGAQVYRQPFGGFKFSGYGSKAGGPAYLGQFLAEVAVSEQTLRRGFAPEG